MAVSIMQLPANINQEKHSLKMGRDGKPVSIEMEGKVLPLDIGPVNRYDPHGQYLAKWAVNEHNRMTGEKLQFVHLDEVRKSEVKVKVGGKLVVMEVYDLYLVAKENDVPKNYEVAVLEYPDTKTLLLFKEIESMKNN